MRCRDPDETPRSALRYSCCMLWCVKCARLVPAIPTPHLDAPVVFSTSASESKNSRSRNESPGLKIRGASLCMEEFRPYEIRSGLGQIPELPHPYCMNRACDLQTGMIRSRAFLATRGFSGAVAARCNLPVSSLGIGSPKSLIHAEGPKSTILDCTSGGWWCAIVGVPWQGSVSACLAWGDLFLRNMLNRVLKGLSLLRPHGTPITAHLQLPETYMIPYQMT